MTITVLTPETDPGNRHGRPDIFLAGGITGCPDWQAQAIQMLTELGPDNLVIANPRRQQPIPPEGPEAMGQIRWEWQYRETAPVILFWFADEQTQPIALFELGGALKQRRNIAIGAHPDYPRRFDVVVQAALDGYHRVVAETLEDTIVDALYHLGKGSK